jgi:hypothetical protein
MASCGDSPSANSETTTEENTTSDPQQAEQAAWDEMMVVHDEVMPKMADLNRTSRSLKGLAAKVEDKTVQEAINQAVKEIEASSEGMMAWMGELKQLKELRKDKSHEEIIAYLQEEKEEIDQIGEEMRGSLKDGKALLAKVILDQKRKGE